MKREKLFLLGAALVGTVLIAACGHVAATGSALPASHPEELGEGRVTCTECHEDQLKGVVKPYATFNHTSNFILNHRQYAAKNDQLCATCHKQSFCNDCHGKKENMKPALKFGDRPDREMIHRGDYLTRHKIDGRIDAASCYKCHGRANNKLCMNCHR
jgi:hypothetical protein